MCPIIYFINNLKKNLLNQNKLVTSHFLKKAINYNSMNSFENDVTSHKDIITISKAASTAGRIDLKFALSSLFVRKQTKRE